MKKVWLNSSQVKASCQDAQLKLGPLKSETSELDTTQPLYAKEL